MEQWTPVAIGGAGGSGTRVPARILREAGVYMGADLNRSEDNLWFTLLLKRPRWLPERLDGAHPEVVQGISILERAMAGRLAPTPADLSFVSRATAEIYRHGHDVSGGGRGRWALGRAATLLASRRRAPRRPFCWGWKEPSTHLVLEALHAHFGWRIRYVHVMRHGLDVAAGARPGEVDPWARAIGEDPGAEPIPFPLAALRYWTAANERAIRLGRELLGDRFLLVRLEDLCASPRESVEELLAFAGVEVPAATLDRLALIPQLPPSGGRHLSLPPGTFPDDDLERLRALGYEPGVFPSRPATAVERPPDGSRAGPRPGPTISVVLCTYQGARYLPEQLRSLTDQTLPPDEVVVCDDGSTDGTLGLLERFAEEVPFTVNVHRNPERLGSTKNFERGIELAKGELIFLCDQDDAWYPRKLEVMAGVLERDPVAGAAFSDADLMDERSRTRDSRLWETLGFTDEMRERLVERPVLVLSRGNVVTGAAMAFRAELRELVLPIPEGWVQDAWIGLLVGAVAGLAPIPEPLIRYRLHGGQQIGVPDPMSSAQHLRRRAQVVRRMTKQERPVLLEQSAYFEQALERLGERADRFPAPQDVLEELAAKIRHLRVRGEMREAGHRVRAVAGELAAGRYHRYSNGLASAAKDLLLADRLGRR